MPEPGWRVWRLFWAMDRRRQVSGEEINAVSHHEIEACVRLYGVRLAPWELRALDLMEYKRMTWLNMPEEERRMATSMTPTLFLQTVSAKK